ncbi:hypothetical protein QA641_33190 [Bradyrhizobium sp. CB1650]|uniref:hypothetical protein n=1 Tax=Bradyrhizobium sp. CB1650 TaxID=3039153 RepID=UPI0024353A68|nr:hypothetical protein [Bradyrhizobium sp. CB1650]WGD50411.1 hypothetical protein QA641_33190 [Bradyrhizobium sp. CB1650]
MSGGQHEGYIDPHDPTYYAPRNLRERAAQPPAATRRSTEHPSLTADGPPLQSPASPQRRDHSDVFSKAVAQAMYEAMEPIEVPAALRNSGRRALLSVAVRFAIAAAVGAGIVVILVMIIPASQRPGVQSNDVTSISSLWQSVKAAIGPAPQRKQVATLAVEDSGGLADAPLPLRMRVGAPPSGAIVAINGLLADARLTSGKRVANEWRVPASEISAVSVIPPDGFVGQMVAMAELRDSNGAVLVVGSSRLTWSPAVTVAPQPSTAVTAVAPARSVAAPQPPQTNAVRKLDPMEISGLVKRGQDLLTSGDVSAARLLLLRAAEGGDARAALLVARTYDPTVLKQLGASGPLVDLAQARNWYQRAKEWGDPEAQRQLDTLTPTR